MAENAASSNTPETLAEREFVMERIFDAPRELVFKAWTEPERLAQWWGPRGWTTTNYGMEVRPGGSWLYCMRGPGGEEAWGKGIYQEIVVPSLIVYNDVFADAEGNPVEGMPQILIRVEFAEYEGKTKLTNRAQFASVADLKAVLEMGMAQGANETWDRLEEYLAQA